MLGVDRLVYYRNLKRKSQKQTKATQVVGLVIEQRIKIPKIGGRKFYFLLKENLTALKIGRDKFFDILRANHLLIISRRSYHKTTHSHHRFRKHANLIKEYHIDEPNKVWVSDITYLGTRDKPAYLSLITDAVRKAFITFIPV